MATYFPGKHQTATGRDAIVDAVTEDGTLVGRVNLSVSGDRKHWWPAMWSADGEAKIGTDHLRRDVLVPIHRAWWLNIYADGPGILRETWGHALIESSARDADPLCRVQVIVDSRVGEGL